MGVGGACWCWATRNFSHLFRSAPGTGETLSLAAPLLPLPSRAGMDGELLISPKFMQANC